MIFATSIVLHPLPLVWSILIAIVMSQLSLTTLIRLQPRWLVAWSVSLFGVTAIYLHRPHPLVRLSQSILPFLLSSISLFGLSFLIQPPVTGIPYTPLLRAEGALSITLLIGFPRLLGLVKAYRFPLWGEAGLLDRLARVNHYGSNIYFTRMGRNYIHDRFGATPEELLRIVRRRPTSMVTGA